MKLLTQASLLGVTFLFIFIWQHSILADYSIPMLGVLIIIFLIISARKRSVTFSMTVGKNDFLGVFVLTSVIMLLVFSTGTYDSPLFFLLYFLEFGIAFVFSPFAVFLFLAGALVILLPDGLKNDVFGNMLRLLPLFLISPLAFVFGGEDKNADTTKRIHTKTLTHHKKNKATK